MFWQDVKKTLKLYIIALIPCILLTEVIAIIWGKENAIKLAPFIGFFAGLWIAKKVYNETTRSW